MRQCPVTCCQRSATGFCTAAPPPTTTLSAEKSSWANPGVFSRPLNSVLTPVIVVNFQLPISLTRAGRSRGLVISTLRLPHFMNDSVEVRQKMWYIGSGAMTISAPSLKLTEIHMPVCSRLARMLRWVSIAPLATPVVPPVYWRKAMSSLFTSTGSKRAERPRSSAARSVMAPSMRHAGTIFLTCLMTKLTSQRFGIGSRSPICVVITCSTAVLPMTCCRDLGEVLDDDDGLGAGVLQLVFEFAGGVQRIDVNHRHPGAQDAEQHHRVLQQIGRHDRHALALAHARQPLQEGGKIARQLFQFGVADGVAEVVIGRLGRRT